MASIVNDRLLKAIQKAESGGESHPSRSVGDRTLQEPAYGAFQIRRPAFDDVRRIYPKEFSGITFEMVQADPSLNRRVAQRYLEALEQHYGITDRDRLIAAYNAGPSARKGTITNPEYVKKVRRYLGEKESAMPQVKPQSSINLIEKGVRRAYRMMAWMGFSPMTSQEIEQMLAKAEPMTSVPGVHRPKPDPASQERQSVSALRGMIDEQIIPPQQDAGEWGRPALQHPMQRQPVMPMPPVLAPNRGLMLPQAFDESLRRGTA